MVTPRAVEPAAPGTQLRSWLRLLRPAQWLKNVLVVAAPLAAGALTDPAVVRSTVLAFVSFTLAAAGTYAVNDVLDREADAEHPQKRHRPVASGVIDHRAALALGVVLTLGAVALPLLVGAPWLAAVVAGYVGLTWTYSLWLKHVALLDIAVVATGFLLRAVAGAVAGGLPMSRWFLVVVGFAAVYVVANKRAAEFSADGRGTGTRGVLAGYTQELLRELRFVAAAVMIVGYVSWALALGSEAIGGDPWATLSIAPFTFGVFRYAVAVNKGLGEAPEEIVLRDHVLQAVGLVWLVSFVAAVHVG